MSLLDLQTVLQQQVNTGGTITIAAATLTSAKLTPSADFDATVQTGLVLTGPLAVAVSGSVPAPDGSTLSVSGNASFLGTSNLPVQLVFSLESDNTTADLLLIATLPGGWTFASSFPLVTGFPFAELAFTQPTYLLATAAGGTPYTWKQQSLTLQRGLNFASDLGMGGPLAILQSLISSLDPSVTAVMVGTIDPTGITNLATGTPVLALAGTIPGSITGDTHFPLSLPQALISTLTDDLTKTQAYWLIFSSTLSVSGKPFSTFQAGIQQSGKSLCFAMVPTDGPITPEEIITLIGGVDFTQYIPAELTQVFSSVGLTSMGAMIGLNPLSLMVISGGIGTTAPWQMGQFTVESLVLNCLVFQPFSSAQNVQFNFTATMEFFPNIFKGDFVVEIIYDLTTKDLAVAANFQGTVSLNDLVTGLSKGAITIPKNFAQVEFDNFGVTFTEVSGVYNYSLYGSAQGTFNITILDSPSIEATLQVTADSATSTYQLVGGLTIGDSFFQVTVNLSGGKQVLTGSWTALNDDYLELETILKALGYTGPEIPPGLDLGLESASITYDITDATFLIAAKSANYGNAVFASLPVNGTHDYFFLLGIDKSFSLSNLPLVGNALASIENIQISQFLVIIGSAVADASIATQLNTLISSSLTGGFPSMPAAGTTGTFVFMAQLAFGNQTLPLSLSLGGQDSAAAPAAPGSGTVAPSSGGATSGAAAASSASPGGQVAQSNSGGISWFTVQKSFGPVTIERIGAMYQSSQQTLWFELQASLALGPLTLDLVGLGIGSPLTSFSPKFSLQGLGLTYSSPPLTLAGSFVNLAPPGASYVEFDGGVTIGTGEFSMMAFGYYGNKPIGSSPPFSSMFIFGALAYDFGGPPAFFVTGAALGFGYNSNLTVPTIDQVQSFPFVQVLPGSTTSNPNLFPSNDPQAVLQVVLGPPAWVAPQAGSLWFAAGITFTSFGLVNSQALVIAEIGPDLVIALVGVSRAQFPQATPGAQDTGPVYAYVELDLEVRFAPAEGVFSLEAVLAKSSFLLDRACVLTGGFAFYVWFGSNPHAGDFVLTLGGYHPGFTPPSYYPVVDAVGFHWAMDSSITISGGVYLAFTPAMLMVGGELNATYQSGNLKAWFDAHADVVVQWKPFWIDADIGIIIGASYKLDLLFTSVTLSVELGCDLEFWGPPTGGSVTVDWYIISFTIPFGTPKGNEQAINGWSEFAQMLPNAGTPAQPNFVSLSASGGLVPVTSKPANGSQTQAGGAPGTGASPPANAPWIVRASQFGFTTGSAIPAKTASVGAAHTFNGSTFNVAPLGWNDVTAIHSVTVQDSGNNDVSSMFAAVPVQKNLPAQLWQAQPASVPGASDQLVMNQLVGVALQVNLPLIGSSPGPVNVGVALSGVDLELAGSKLPVSNSAQPVGDIPVDSGQTVGKIADTNTGIASTAGIAARNAIFAALSAPGVQYAPATANDPMTHFAQEIGCALSAEPLLVS
jgi:hypothetical protein